MVACFPGDEEEGGLLLRLLRFEKEDFLELEAAGVVVQGADAAGCDNTLTGFSKAMSPFKSCQISFTPRLSGSMLLCCC